MTKKKRSKAKHPNLKRQYNPRIRGDALEIDYYDRLNEEERTWLDQFNKEAINASGLDQQTPEAKELRDERRKLKKEINAKRKDLEKLEKRLIRVEKKLEKIREDAGCMYTKSEDVKQIYDENNARNTCIYNRHKAQGTLIDLDADGVDKFVSDVVEQSGLDYEDKIIDDITKKKGS